MMCYTYEVGFFPGALSNSWHEPLEFLANKIQQPQCVPKAVRLVTHLPRPVGGSVSWDLEVSGWIFPGFPRAFQFADQRATWVAREQPAKPVASSKISLGK